MRRAHAEGYHEGYTSVVRVKARWSTEEMTLVARCELSLLREGYKGSINSALNANFPSRTTEAIKGLRKQSKYINITNEIILMTNNELLEINTTSHPELGYKITRYSRYFAHTYITPQCLKG